MKTSTQFPNLGKGMSKEIHHHHTGGIGLGSVIAVVLSYMKWHSIGWAIVHGLFGWFYVIYYLFTYGVPQ